MPTYFIRIWVAALAVLLGWSCLVPISLAQGIIFKDLEMPPIVIPQMYPGSSEIQRMQISLDTLRRHQIKKRKKAGEVIKYGQITVTSQPKGAKVYVSSFVYYGRTPYTKAELLPGLHRVTVRREGYYEQARMVQVDADKTSQVSFTLKPIPYARLIVQPVPKGAKIKIIGIDDNAIPKSIKFDENGKGEIIESGEEHKPEKELEPSDYLVQVSHPKYGAHRLWAVLSANEKLTLKADLRARPGKIEVAAKQAGATVYLDGQEAGSAPLTISGLLPGPHKLQVWKSLFRPVTKLVWVAPAKTVSQSIDLAPAEHFTNSLGMEFVKIPAGSFMMGHRDLPETEALKALGTPRDDLSLIGVKLGLLYREYPRHLVRINKAFYIQTSEITRGQWLEVMGDYRGWRDMRLRDHPMILESVAEVQDFLAKLNARDKGKFRYQLPTEAQWEYAARAGTTSPFFTGENVSSKQANINGKWTYNNVIDGVFRNALCKIKSFPPNPWGLYDTIGNTQEVCADGYDYFFYPRSPIVDPKRGKTKNKMFVVRGGHYDRGPEKCTAASRSMIETVGPSANSYVFGIRLVAIKLNDKK